MSWQNVLALAVFVVVCGLIAYVGDLLGRRMGKRRLSLFGLRPRYTAIVTTTITGMLIAIMTITVMATASKAVQQLVLRGDQILRELSQVRDDYAQAQKQLRSLRGTADDARHEAALAVTQRDRLAESISKVEQDLHRNEAGLARAEKQLAGAKGNLTAASREIAVRRTEIARQKRQLEYLVKNINEYGPLYKVIRERRVIFRPEEEVARRVIRCAQSRPKIRGEVMALLDDAGKRAAAEGATVSEDSKRAVRILPYEISGKMLREAQNIDLVTDKIAAGEGSVVLVVVSIGNAAAGEPTLVDFRPYQNRIVYPAGRVVASARIDGSAARGVVFGELMRFLRYDVRMTAIKEGVIPTFDEDGQPSVGQISYDRLFDLMDRIRSTGAQARITASAAYDTWSADSLSLTFDVSKSP